MKPTDNNQKCYNLDERLDHIAYMLNVRTAGKAYENFIVNAIYARVGNPDLMPYTQQYVHSPNDPRKYYLLDLYFPQINFGIEVDEGHHLNEEQIVKDQIREEDVRTAIECEEVRIPIFKEGGIKRTYEEIGEDIDKVVMTIRAKIAEKGPLKWETNEDRKQAVVSKGVFDVKDDVFYGSITEIYNICGGKRTGKAKGEFQPAKILQKCYYTLNTEYKLWVPILAIEDQDGVVINSVRGYENSLSEDHDILKEKSNHSIDPLMDIQYKRVVFMRMKDRFGRPCIKFIGVFELSTESTEYLHVYNRIAKAVRISDLN